MLLVAAAHQQDAAGFYQNTSDIPAAQKYTSSSAIAETVLQGGSVLAKSGRRYSADNIGLSSTTVT